jgi:hypothetical protein
VSHIPAPGGWKEGRREGSEGSEGSEGLEGLEAREWGM